MIGGYPLYTVNHFEDFRACLDGVEKLYGERPLFVTYDMAGEAHTATYADFAADVRALAASLCVMGLAGKHIALAGENSYLWMVSLFAITTIGSVAVTIDTEQADEAITAMIWRADAQAVLCGESLLPLFCAMREGNGLLQYVVCLDAAPAAGNVLPLRKLIDDGRLRTWMDNAPVIDPDQPAMIVYTSGTTSISKPVLLSHRNMLTNACNAASMVSMGPKVYVPLPLYHTYGLTAGVMAHLTQGLVICINGNLKTMLRDVTLFNPTSIAAVPLIIEALYSRICQELIRRGEIDRARQYLASAKGGIPPLDDEGFPFRDAVRAVMGTEIRMMVSGGAHMNQKIVENMEALGVQVIQGYGITECSPMITANRNGAEVLLSVGLTMPDTEIRIVDDEILVRGASVSKGYYKDDALTAESFRDGWFHTGDIGAFDRNGFLFINGRKKTLIVFKNGKKVTPEEIEGYVADIPMIQEAMAYGVINGTSSDDVKLALMVYPNPQLAEGMQPYEILQHLQARIDELNRRLPVYKQIHTIKIKDAPFEKTALQKIKRYTI